MKKLAMRLIVAGFLLLPACATPLANSTAPATNAVAVVASEIGDRSELGNVILTPLEIVEDSRCPANVRCIQAGTVRLKVRLQEHRKSWEAIIALEQPARLEGEWLHLVGVCPAQIVPQVLPQRDYRFTFAITAHADRPAVEVACA